MTLKENTTIPADPRATSRHKAVIEMEEAAARCYAKRTTLKEFAFRALVFSAIFACALAACTVVATPLTAAASVLIELLYLEDLPGERRIL